MKKELRALKAQTESFIALARSLERMPRTPQRDRLLSDATRTLALIRATLLSADDTRKWALGVFGAAVDRAPVVTSLLHTVTHSLSSMLGYETYRINRYMTGRVSLPHAGPMGTAIAAAIGRILLAPPGHHSRNRFAVSG